MSYTNVTKPTQGDTTRKALIDAMIDNDAFFNSRLSVLSALGISNGGFELDTNSDGYPDEWTVTLYTGGSFEITGVGESDTENQSGAKAVKFTSPGGGSNGGGYMEMNDFIDVTPSRLFSVSWQSKSTVATVRNKVIVRWFDDGQTFISSDTIFTSVDNPTGWEMHYGLAYPPAPARYAKVRIVGAEDSTTVAGSVYFDDMQVGRPNFTRQLVLETPGTYTVEIPAGIGLVFVEALGGGGSGGRQNASGTGPGGGGGSGGYAAGMVKVAVDTSYTVTVGAGGTSTPSEDGGDSSFGADVVGGGGVGGANGTSGGAGAGGAGGTSSSTTGTTVDGTDGEDGVSLAPAGTGGVNSFTGGLVALGGASIGTIGDSAISPGGGGGGSKGTGISTAGAGGNGWVKIYW